VAHCVARLEGIAAFAVGVAIPFAQRAGFFHSVAKLPCLAVLVAGAAGAYAAKKHSKRGKRKRGKNKGSAICQITTFCSINWLFQALKH
jgi:hypothetical protein